MGSQNLPFAPIHEKSLTENKRAQPMKDIAPFPKCSKHQARLFLQSTIRHPPPAPQLDRPD